MRRRACPPPDEADTREEWDAYYREADDWQAEQEQIARDEAHS